jgi:AraC-like DNA-binding protein
MRGAFWVHHTAMTGIEAVSAVSAHVFSRHMHEQFGIGLIEGGAQTSASGRGQVEAGPGDIITVNPGEIHDGAPIGDQGRAWKMVYFAPGIVSDAALDISEGGVSFGEFFDPVMRDHSLATVFGRFFPTLTGGYHDRLLCEELLAELLGGALQIKTGLQSPVPSALRCALDRIEDDPASDVSLADLADLSGLSRFQVLRAFRKVTGFTPHAYLMQKRCGLARRRIGEGHPLAAAAAMSGFADQSHMTRIFVRHFGFTPGEYAAASM